MTQGDKKDSVLLRIIVKALTAYAIVCALIVAFFFFLFFKFIVGMSLVGAFLTTVGIFAFMAVVSYFFPDEKASFFDLFD